MFQLRKFTKRTFNFIQPGFLKGKSLGKINKGFSNIELRIPEPEDESGSSKYKPENRFKFNKKGYSLLYEFNMASPHWGLLFVGGIFLLVSYQLIYRWYKSNRFLNIVCSLGIVPLSIMLLGGLYQMYVSAKRISVSRCGKKLLIKTFMNPWGRTINIKDIKEFKVEEKEDKIEFDIKGEKKEKENKLTTYRVVYGKGSKLRIHVSENKKESFISDNDLFRAIMNARECDFSESN